jgi:hypothetical protein
LGLFGEDRPECIDYLNFSGQLPEGKSPSYCRVQLNEDSNPVGSASYPAPGNAGSRQPQAVDALFYQGWLDGQATVGDFEAVLNWRKDEQCTLTQCRDAADPAACQAASTDVFGELNSACVGVAEGFLGYNHQSWPASYLTVWPTGWFQSTDDSSWNDGGHGDVNQLAFPEVRTDTGFDDSYSLWFGNTDQVADPRCFPSSDFSLPPSLPCPDQRRVVLTQRIALPAQDLDNRNPPSYRIVFRYRATDLANPTTLRVSFFVREAGGAQISYGSHDVATLPPGTSGWQLARTKFTLDPARHSDASYDGIKFRIETAGVYAGELGIDAVRVLQVGQGGQLAINGSFREGHRQVATGDHAATFLDRLGGVAFWGSVSHHQSIGCAFCTSGLEPLVYFLRGLPLGDAVWFDESNNSGILYGDPLYSPVAVRLTPINDTDTFRGVVDLYGSTVNGRDPAQASTRYAIDVCPGDDFRVCDQQTSWQSTGISGMGGETNMLLGRWDTSELAPGSYTLRLAVTSQDSVTGRSQTLYDYYPVRGDTDGDGVPDDQDNCIDMANGPAIPDEGGNSQRDTDNDGYGNLCDADFNNDGFVGPYDLSKFKSVYYDSTTSPDQDLDGDGIIGARDLSIFKSYYGKPPGISCVDLSGSCGTGQPRNILIPANGQANDPAVPPSSEPAPDSVPVTGVALLTNPAPATDTAPTTEVALLTNPAPATDTAPTTEVALVTNPAPATDPAPTTEVALVTNPAPATDPAPTTEVVLVTNPAPVTDPAPTTEVVIVTNPAPVTEVVPVIEPVAKADPVPAPVPVMPVSTQCENPGVAPPDATTPWVINLLSSTDRADVDTLAARADSLNIITVVQQAEINGTRYWRLQVTGFDSLSSATESAEIIKAKLGLDNVWIFSQKLVTNSNVNTDSGCSSATQGSTAPAEVTSGLSQVQTAAAQQTAQGSWVINLLSSTELVNVERLAARAASLELETAIEQASVKGSQIWRLQITGFDSYANASEYAENVKQLLGIKEVWIFKKR